MKTFFFTHRRLLMLAILTAGLLVLGGCDLAGNETPSDYLDTAGTEIQSYIPLIRIISLSLLGVAWVWYGGIYGLSLLGFDQYWQGKRNWWKGGVALTIGLPMISELVISMIR